jgi:hypothetical protein
LCRATAAGCCRLLLPPSTVLTPPELMSQSSCVTFPLLLSRLFISFSGGWIRVAEFSVFYAARFGSDFVVFFFSLGFSLGPIVELFFLFCFAAQEDFVFVLWLLLLLLQGHDGFLVGSVGVFWKLKVQGR